MFEQAPLPLQVTFWRMNLNSDRVLHHSPLLQITGVGPESYFIDILHSWHLGPLGMLLATIVWFLLDSPFLSSPFLRGFMTPGELHKLGLLHIRGALMEYYRCRYKTDAQWRKNGSWLWGLTMGMIGSNKNPIMSAKGAEMRGVLPFFISQLEQFENRFGELGYERCVEGQYLLASARAAGDFEDLLNEAPQLVPTNMRLKIWHAFMRHAVCFAKAGGDLKPKHHLMIHLLQRMHVHGNPLYYHTYRDESLNGIVAKIAKSCHRWCFAEMTHRKYAVLEQTGNSVIG